MYINGAFVEFGKQNEGTIRILHVKSWREFRNTDDKPIREGQSLRIFLIVCSAILIVLTVAVFYISFQVIKFGYATLFLNVCYSVQAPTCWTNFRKNKNIQKNKNIKKKILKKFNNIKLNL